MIQLTGWIFIFVFSTAFGSDIPYETTSETLIDVSLTTVKETEQPTNEATTGIPEKTTTESPKMNSNLSLAEEEAIENQETSENSSVLAPAAKPVSMSLTTHNQDERTLGETILSTTAILKDSVPSETPVEISTVSNSEKNLYYDARTTTEYGISQDMSAESPDMSTDEDANKSTLSMGLISENIEKSSVDDISVSINPVYDSSLNDKSADNDENQAEGSELIEVKKIEIRTTTKSPVSKRHHSRSNFDNEKSDSMVNIGMANETGNDDERSVVTEGTHNENVFKDQTTILPSEKLIPKYEETTIELMDSKKLDEDLNEEQNVSELFTKLIENSTDKVIIFTDFVTENINDDNLDNISADATETNSNSTRNPKRIHGGETDRYPEGRIRPIHPDPGYANRPEIDLVRPYRPDSPLHQYPYYRPTPDHRTPVVIREDKDYTRPPRPDPEYTREYTRASFRPNYSYSKPSHEETSSSKPSLVESSASKPYRPSFNRPYHSQSSFGRPYRPDFHRPASKPTDDYPVSPKPTTDIKSISSEDVEVSEHSRADFDYTRQSEVASGFTKHYQSDTRPSQLKPNLNKPHRPYDSEASKHSKPSSSSPSDEYSENREPVKISKPDTETNRPSSFYPRPGFGNNYHTSETSVRPFSVGTVTSAKNLTRVEFIKADCFDNHMKVTMRFNGTFNGLVYSSGYAQDSSCSYVNGSGRNHYEFYIRLNRCGTLGQQEVAEQRLRSASRRRQERAQYLVNTVTVQYNPVIEEEIDEHFRVTCEYGYDFWKTVTFPVVNVESSAVKVRTGSPVVFTLPPPQCNMEIRSGFGPSGTRVSGPVNVGDPLTLVIHMKSESTGFDILVSNCFAHNGAQKRLQLIDSNGCVVQDKLVSPFRGVSSPDRTQQVTLYSYLKAFRFTGSPALYIECDVHMCHGSCPPQRCYWRHLYKRSVQEVTTEDPATTTDNVISESVSLFQALEVRHDEVDSPNSLALRNLNGMDMEDMLCLRTGGFAALLACLLLLLFLTTGVSVCMCHRMRKLKQFVEAPDTKHFVEFDGHVPCK